MSDKMSGRFSEKLKNLQIRGAMYSLSLHLFFVLVYLLATYTPAYQNIDFNLANDPGGFAHPKKRTQKKVSITDLEKQTTPDEQKVPDQNDTTSDTSEEEPTELDSAEDLSFHADAVAPRPITILKKIYPEKARQKEVEAVAYVSVVISSTGQVLAVNVSGVKLKKKSAPEIDAALKNEFAIAAKEILKYARFTPAIVKGKRIPVIMDIPLNFTLN